MIAKAPVGRQEGLPDDAGVLLDDQLGRGSGEDVEVQDSAKSPEGDGRCWLKDDL